MKFMASKCENMQECEIALIAGTACEARSLAQYWYPDADTAEAMYARVVKEARNLDGLSKPQLHRVAEWLPVREAVARLDAAYVAAG